jgi:serine protease Do
MNNRARTIASFFTVAMAAMLVGAVLTSQIQRPEPALARPAEPATAAQGAPARGAITLDTFKDLARGLTPGVVNINTSKVIKRQRNRDPFRDFFGDDMMDRFFGPQSGSRTQRALGSGFFIDKQGYILTNRHVVEGMDQISATLVSGKTYDAKLVGRDARTDVALLKIDPKETVTTLELGDSDQAEVGEWVMAIGNPFGLERSVTVGVVSFKGRAVPLTQFTSVDMIQTDASINPGNSGGPLINTRGQVVGINTLIFTQGAPQSAGVGFAVPINVAKEVVPQLRETGRVIRGWLGVYIQPVSEDMAKSLKMRDSKGAIVSEVTPGSPAEKAGMKPGDVVLAADDRPVQDNGDLSRYISTRPPGTNVKLKVFRDGAEKTISVTLGTVPDENEEGEESSRGGGRAQLGMTLRNLTPEIAQRLDLPRGTKGALVMDVEAGEAAESAGLQQGDVIVSVNGVNVDSVEAFEAETAKAKADGMARLRVRRENQHLFLVLKLK